jgi:hypothetical protein
MLWNQKETDAGYLLFAGKARSYRRLYALGCSCNRKGQDVETPCPLFAYGFSAVYVIYGFE